MHGSPLPAPPLSLCVSLNLPTKMLDCLNVKESFLILLVVLLHRQHLGQVRKRNWGNGLWTTGDFQELRRHHHLQVGSITQSGCKILKNNFFFFIESFFKRTNNFIKLKNVLSNPIFFWQFYNLKIYLLNCLTIVKCLY